MKRTAYLAILCVGAGLTIPATAWAQQSQQSGQPMGQQQYGQQMPGQQTPGQQMGQQMPGQQMGQQTPGQQLTEQRIRNFFSQAQDVLQRTARTQDPAQLQQYLNQYLEPDATITSVTELYIGDRHIATTIAHATDETVTEALGYAATALQGRKLVSDYNVQIDVRDIQMMPGQNAARVMTVIQETGVLGGPMARRVAEARERIGEMRGQMQQDQGRGQGQGQWGRAQDGQMGQTGQMGQMRQRMQQGWGQSQDGMGMGMGGGPGRGGAPEQGVRFQSRADCTHDVMLDQGQIRIGNTFCRGTMRLV